MGARHAVILTLPKSAYPDQLVSYQQSASLSPLFATLTNSPQLAENKAALSPFLATHTDFAPASPVFATHTKTTGVYTNNSILVHNSYPLSPQLTLFAIHGARKYR